ncbi:TGB-1 [Rubus canadensis virus 1]|uniref:TGB-1 n=1 Tax=Rubus canadensis virus 1 TaxID=1243178 RepID=K4MRE6_9VIRU|nr:TGB-1 [Rubus canadensis virus 1]AFV31418.1 TGB-1 [Rubus canadensis virus 1]
MEDLLHLLEISSFERTSVPLSSVLVVHCVAGAGKTSLLRKWLGRNPNGEVRTCGVPDKENLTGRRIKAWGGNLESKSDDQVWVLDEYCELGKHFDYSKFGAIFCDNLQFPEDSCLEAHYICLNSHRLSRNTISFLNKEGFNIHSLKEVSKEEEEVVFGGIYSEELEGQIISLDREAEKLLKNHSVAFKRTFEVRGLEFERVCLVSSRELVEIEPHVKYLAFTRHLRSVMFLSPDASHTS